MDTISGKKRNHSPSTEVLSLKMYKSSFKEIANFVLKHPDSLSCVCRIYGHSGFGSYHTIGSRSVEFSKDMTITLSAALGHSTHDWSKVENGELQKVNLEILTKIVNASLNQKKVKLSDKTYTRRLIKQYYIDKLKKLSIQHDILRSVYSDLKMRTHQDEITDIKTKLIELNIYESGFIEYMFAHNSSQINVWLLKEITEINKELQETQELVETSKNTYKTYNSNAANLLLTRITSRSDVVPSFSIVFIAGKQYPSLQQLLLNAWNDYTSETNHTIFKVYESQIIHCSEESQITNYLNKESFAYKLIRQLSLAKHSSEPYFPRDVNSFLSSDLTYKISTILPVNSVFRVACAEINDNNPRQIRNSISNSHIVSDDESTPGGTRKAQTLSLRGSKKRLRKTRRKREIKPHYTDLK